jgi:hypothetical protein
MIYKWLQQNHTLHHFVLQHLVLTKVLNVLQYLKVKGKYVQANNPILFVSQVNSRMEIHVQTPIYKTKQRVMFFLPKHNL